MLPLTPVPGGGGGAPVAELPCRRGIDASIIHEQKQRA